MKVQCFLPVTILVSVALMGVMKIRKKEYDTVDKRNRFQDVKLRVTEDVLEEYQIDKSETHDLLEKTKLREKAMQEEVNTLRTKAQEVKIEVDICKGKQKSTGDELASAQTELKDLQTDYDQEKTSWKTESETLKQQLAARSTLCGLLKTKDIDVDIVRKLCGDDVIVEAHKKEAKLEAPKKEEAKPEAPKQQEAKPEAPKQQEAKPEAPKQQEAKPEAPKQQEAKPEAPKQQEAQPEAPKQQEAKPEAPKQQEAQPEAPKQEEAKPEAPK